MPDPLLAQIETLYRTRFDHFFRVARATLRDPDLAWDAVHDGFAGALRGRTGFRGDAPRQRLVLFLRYYADLDERSVGRILEIERGTVSATLHAAMTARPRRSLQGGRFSRPEPAVWRVPSRPPRVEVVTVQTRSV